MNQQSLIILKERKIWMCDFEEWDRTNIEVHHSPETRDDWAQRLLKQLKEEFDKVNVAGKQSQIFADHG
jgi:hypothetical protein